MMINLFSTVIVWVVLASATVNAETITITKQVCQEITKHTPAADVAYQPGVDARGKKVAPADLSGTQAVKLPDVITIDVNPQIEKWLTKTDRFPNDRLKTSEIKLGTIKLEGDKITYNGQPLSDDQQDNLSVLCLNSL